MSSTTLLVVIDTIVASANRCASSPSAMPASGTVPDLLDVQGGLLMVAFLGMAVGAVIFIVPGGGQ